MSNSQPNPPAPIINIWQRFWIKLKFCKKTILEKSIMELIIIIARIYIGVFNYSFIQAISIAPLQVYILCRSFTSKCCRQLRVKDIPKVPTRRLEWESNCDPSDTKRRTYHWVTRPHNQWQSNDNQLMNCLLKPVLCALNFNMTTFQRRLKAPIHKNNFLNEVTSSLPSFLKY